MLKKIPIPIYIYYYYYYLTNVFMWLKAVKYYISNFSFLFIDPKVSKFIVAIKELNMNMFILYIDMKRLHIIVIDRIYGLWI